MLRINNLSMPVGYTQAALLQKAAKALRLSPGQIRRLELVRQSIDARRRGEVHMVLSVNAAVEDEAAVLRRVRDKNVSPLLRQAYRFPPVTRRPELPPVVTGMGPAGLFAALFLARAGIPCIVLERGAPVEERAQTVEHFWRTGELDPASNVQFGEGGAGTFSDGKLSTGTHDPRIQAVLDTLVAAGAPEDVAYSFRPHVGTDVLRQVVRVIRQELLALGCDVRFGHRLTGLEQSDGRLTALQVCTQEGTYTLPAAALVLAPGHSARDTFQMLLASGVPMEPKPFAVGVRIEHRQEAVSRAQYGDVWDRLPPADYRLSCHLPGGRSVFSFCVCPGGAVVAAASEPGRLVTNGMSLRARNGENINGALLVGVTPQDFDGADALAGVRFQQRWEQAAFDVGGGGFIAPAQRVEDFLRAQPSRGGGTVHPTYRPGVRWTALDDCLPPYVLRSLREALPLLDGKLHGFAHPDAVLTGVEMRSSSPVRIPRDASGQSALRGVYPCGEGCGYAGGIVSAAVDGIRAAEAVTAGMLSLRYE
ncbi:MAG: FAD-dependent monooxygenase [Oscillospiraceae bacterium]|nr:FAD-dependent monooxygenase [Oscillospiraceae bacterium]MCD8256044.1 FAD-dependent monooxygenase [Oscillospiraceae bacterium]